MLPYRTTKTPRIEDCRVRQEDRPGWVRGTTRVPLKGEEIFCAAGAGTVTALHGKTGDGSRLIQIGLTSEAKHPFFAAASNVLLPPAGSAPGGNVPPAGAGALAPAGKAWLSGSGNATYLT